eukprot:CAMPEP_0201550082 /NCGR_PEP_ID=MMETSP0173_2-20130828/6491_1 /ASSEMBLY_ACC=CAM_ASM_000268 /TAXON_ID=218659 /ORGANISM="Vexillifera sp., Strain DIVA3 564/2" /LENGTH=441 /DNA_ID=CAMNT_0047959963 /DNA_START=95 /DNA_END=1417 /DNA_ORIENTATION=+
MINQSRDQHSSSSSSSTVASSSTTHDHQEELNDLRTENDRLITLYDQAQLEIQTKSSKLDEQEEALHVARTHASELEQKVSTLQEKNMALDDELARHRQTSGNAAHIERELRVELEDALNAQNKLQQQVTTLTKQVSVMRVIQDELDFAKEALETVREKASQFDRAKAKLEQFEQVQNSLDTLKKEHALLQETNIALQKDAKRALSLDTQLEQALKENASLSVALTKTKSQLSHAQNQLALVQKSFQELESNAQQGLKVEPTQFDQVIDSSTSAELQTLMGEFQHSSNAQVDELEGQVEQLTLTVEKMRSELSQANRVNEQLQQEMSQQQTSSSGIVQQTAVIEALTKEKQQLQTYLNNARKTIESLKQGKDTDETRQETQQFEEYKAMQEKERQLMVTAFYQLGVDMQRKNIQSIYNKQQQQEEVSSSSSSSSSNNDTSA